MYTYVKGGDRARCGQVVIQPSRQPVTSVGWKEREGEVGENGSACSPACSNLSLSLFPSYSYHDLVARLDHNLTTTHSIIHISTKKETKTKTITSTRKLKKQKKSGKKN